MTYNFNLFKQNTTELNEWLKREYSTIRTGRASPAILDGVNVEAYDAHMPINQLANISVEDARMIRITPWDTTQTKAIEKAIIASGLGLSVTDDGKGLRVMFPDLTSDRRASLMKIAKQKLEDARVTLRGEREKVLKDIETQEKDGTLSEDEKFRIKAELQKMVDDISRSLDELLVKGNF